MRRRSEWWRAAWSGVVAGAVGIGLSELLAGLVPGAASLVLAIGQLVINLQPPGAKQLVVDWFGTADKLALNVAVVLVALAASAALGILARRSMLAAQAGVVALGALGVVAAFADPLVDPVLVVLTTATAVVVAIWMLRRLLRLAFEPARVEMPDWDRRRFLGTSLQLAAGSVVAAAAGRFLLDGGARTTAVVQPLPSAGTTAPPLPDGAELGVPGVTPIIVPNRRFYRIDTQLLTPRVDAATWALSVVGMVDRELRFTYDDLRSMPQREEYVTIACVSNEVGGDLVGNARWSGVPLLSILGRAGVRDGATQVVGRSVDGWTAGFPTAWLDGPGRYALVALGMNGDPLPAEHGYPARLIVPGLYGYVSATKWLSEIQLTTLEAFDAYWVPLGWAKEAPILTQSRIDTPALGANLRAGNVAVAGVAWAPERGIAHVEVQVDDDAWREARLSTPISTATWVQFVYPWPAQSGQHRLRVRATDGSGSVQPEGPTPPAPDGARGYHTIVVTVG